MEDTGAPEGQTIGSGLPCLDERLGGLLPGRTYVFTGAPGTGKTIAALEFLSAGIDAGEQVAMLTVDDPTDLLSQGEFLGLDLEKALAEERLILLRYQLDFQRRFGRSATSDVAFDELRRMLGENRPSRLVIDTIVPFLDAGHGSGAEINRLVRFVEELDTTAIITYPGDLAGLYDRRLEPLAQRAGAILHFSTEADRTGRIEIRKVRFQVPSTAPIHFRIESGVGISAIADQGQRRAYDVPPDTKRKLLVLNLGQGFPEEMLGILRERFDVAVRSGIASAFASLSGSATGAVLIDVSRDTVNDAITLVRELRKAGNQAPIALVTRFHLRSNDRARALRAGADEFLTTDILDEEVLLRVEALARRGRGSQRSSTDREEPLVMQPGGEDGALAPLDDSGFRAAVHAHLHGDRIPFFTIVTLRPLNGGDVRELTDVTLSTIRVDGGDLAGVVDGRVALYLHSARQKDLLSFLGRVREGWRQAGHGELEVDAASYPADEQRVEALLERSEE